MEVSETNDDVMSDVKEGTESGSHFAGETDAERSAREKKEKKLADKRRRERERRAKVRAAIRGNLQDGSTDASVGSSQGLVTHTPFVFGSAPSGVPFVGQTKVAIPAPATSAGVRAPIPLMPMPPTINRATGPFNVNPSVQSAQDRRIEPDVNPNLRQAPTQVGVNALQAKRVADSLIRHSETYRKLVKLERNIDVAIIRKQMGLRGILGSSPATKQRTFRLYLFNSYKAKEKKEAGARGDGVAMWTLRIQGWVMPDPEEEEAWAEGRVSCFARCTDVFDRVVVELDKEMYPDDYLIEWNRSEDENTADGFEISRPAKDEFTAKIIMFIHYRPDRFRLSQALSKLLGVESETKAAIFSSVWKYIKGHRLQASEDKTQVTLNDGLLSLLSTKEEENPSKVMKLSNVFEIIKSHMLPMEPVELEYPIGLSGSPLENQSCYDLSIPLSDDYCRGNEWREISTVLGTSKIPDNAELQNLRDKHLEALEQLGVHRRRKEFFERFSEDPSRFINHLILSQTRDLRLMAGGTARPHDEERKSSFYQQQWVNEAVPRYLLKRVINDARQPAPAR